MACCFRYLSQAVFLLVFSALLPTIDANCSEDGVVTSGDICWMTSQDKMTWYEANYYCQHYDMSPAYLDDDSAIQSLEDFLSGLNRDGGYWLSGTDLLLEGSWQWYDFNDDLENTEITRWAPNKPLGSIRLNCMFVAKRNNDYNWYDGMCHAKKFALCMQIDT